jgi:hypothetical protein
MFLKSGLLVAIVVCETTMSCVAFADLPGNPDVGGGAVLNTVEHKLSDVTLRWMVQQVIQAQCGIRFDDAGLDELAIPRVTLPAMVENSVKANKDVATRKDAFAPIHDQLKAMPIWWALEIIPMHYRFQDKDGQWETTFGYVQTLSTRYARSVSNAFAAGILEEVGVVWKSTPNSTALCSGGWKMTR